MAHNSYPAGTPTGTVPALYVVPATDWKTVIDQCFKSINGDDGGTWAPGVFITVGGAGFQLAGTSHEIAASARLTVRAGGEIRLEDTASAVTLPILRLNGSGGDILLYVKSHISTIEAKSGSLVQINSGAALDVYGALTLRNTGGPGAMFCEANTGISFASGSTLLLQSGAAANIFGTATVKAATGSLVIENGASVSNHGAITHQLDAVEVYIQGAVRAGIVTDQSRIVRTGSGGRTAHRPSTALPANADADITVASDSYTIPSILTNSRVYTIRHTGTVPVAGERIKVSRISQVTPDGLHSATIAREDATAIFTFYVGKEGFAEFEFDGTQWNTIAGAQYASGPNGSGYYDDVW